MAAPFFSTPFQPYVYQSQQSVVTPFQILGGEAQVLQIMLKPQEKVTAKPGTMCYMSGSVQINNIYFPEHEGGIWQWLFGKSATSIVFTNAGSDDGFVGISAPSPARILPIDLANFGGEIFCQPDAFLCSLNDVTISNAMDQRARNIASGVEVILKQKLVGQGLAFLVGGGSVVQKVLEAGEVVVVDAACLVAMTTTINSQVKYSHPVRRAVFGNMHSLNHKPVTFHVVVIKHYTHMEYGKDMISFHRLPKLCVCSWIKILISFTLHDLFGGHGLREGDYQVTVSLTGPGIVFIQSLPFHRLSQRIARAVTPPGMRENPKFFIQIAIFFFLAYVMIVSSLILTDV